MRFGSKRGAKLQCGTTTITRIGIKSGGGAGISGLLHRFFFRLSVFWTSLTDSWPFKAVSHNLFRARVAQITEMQALWGEVVERGCRLLIGIGAYGRLLRIKPDRD